MKNEITKMQEFVSDLKISIDQYCWIDSFQLSTEIDRDGEYQQKITRSFRPSRTFDRVSICAIWAYLSMSQWTCGLSQQNKRTLK